MSRKRKYDSGSRRAGRELAKRRVLDAARKLFSTWGIEATTIEDVAALAQVAGSTVYALFKSKAGILKALMHGALFGPRYQALVEKAMSMNDPVEMLKMAPRIARTIFDVEKSEMGLIRGASGLSAELKKLEREGELQRYERQETTLRRLAKAKILPTGLDLSGARDILWTLTSRDIYRMLVMERGWPSEKYERWLTDVLVATLTSDLTRHTAKSKRK